MKQNLTEFKGEMNPSELGVLTPLSTTDRTSKEVSEPQEAWITASPTWTWWAFIKLTPAAAAATTHCLPVHRYRPYAGPQNRPQSHHGYALWSHGIKLGINNKISKNPKHWEVKSGTKILDKIHVRAEGISELKCFQVVFGEDSRDEPNSSRKDAIKYGVTSRTFTEDKGGEEHRKIRINVIKQ